MSGSESISLICSVVFAQVSLKTYIPVYSTSLDKGLSTMTRTQFIGKGSIKGLFVYR